MMLAVWIHLVAALWALAFGAVQLISTKGTRKHRWRGWSWMLAMIVTAVSSFWLHSDLAILGPFSNIHLLSLWVLVCVVISLLAVRRRRLDIHRNFLVGAYLGLLGAGLGALAPGRLISGWLFGA
ncbi:DUF2306 domain-containing protein [Halomonas shantousis]